MNYNKIKISWTINFNEKDFELTISSLYEAHSAIEFLAALDLGDFKTVDSIKELATDSIRLKGLELNYKRYRRKLGLNHPSLITDNMHFVECYCEEEKAYEGFDFEGFDFARLVARIDESKRDAKAVFELIQNGKSYEEVFVNKAA